MASCPSRYDLTGFEAGDMPETERARIHSHLETCDRCREMIGALRNNIALFDAGREAHLGRLLSRIDAEPVAGPMPGRTGTVVRLRYTLGALAAAAVVAFGLYVVVGQKAATDSPGGEIRFKGTLSLEVVAKRGGKQFRVEQGDVLTEDDALRFIVTAGEAGFLDLFSVDRDGRISPFYPDSNPAVAPEPFRIDAPGRHVLPGSVILDDAVGEEHIIVVFSPTPFNRKDIQQRIKSDGGLRPTGDANVVVEQLSIQKESKLMQ